MLIKGIQSSNCICLHLTYFSFIPQFILLGLQNDFGLRREQQQKNLLGVGRVRIEVLVQGWDSSWVPVDWLNSQLGAVWGHTADWCIQNSWTAILQILPFHSFQLSTGRVTGVQGSPTFPYLPDHFLLPRTSASYVHFCPSPGRREGAT